MASTDDPAFAAWVARAREADIATEAARRGAVLKRMGSELVGPCPRCGGRDRFAIHPRKGIFLCRGGGVGGDVIAMVEYLEGCDFVAACASLIGPPPSRDGRALPQAAPPAAVRAEPDRGAQADRDAERYRLKERGKALALCRGAAPIAGTRAEAYLRARGLDCPPGAPLGFHADCPYWRNFGGDAWRVIHRGPAMLAAIRDDGGAFQGVHMTWIDADRPGEKAAIADPETGELLPAKKVRGTKRRAAIRLVQRFGARRLVIGEGIETVLSVWMAERGHAIAERSLYWSAIDLGHLSGKAADRAPHPTLTKADKRGRKRRVLVPGRTPLKDPERDLMPPAGIAEIVILGDGDSDPFTTRLALTRAAARFAAPGRAVRIAMAPAGMDFNDAWRRGLAAA